MKDKEFKKILKGLIDGLNEVKYSGDISDIGNEVGFLLGKQLQDPEEFKLFTRGLMHGIDLTKRKAK
jgi:hypothetical protein